MSEVIGQVVGIDERRELIDVRDTLGNVCEMIPVEGSIRLRFKLNIPLASGRALEFWVEAPPVISEMLSENVRIARSLEELEIQLKSDLTGIKDQHDVFVDKYTLDLQDVAERALAYQKDYEARLAAAGD